MTIPWEKILGDVIALVDRASVRVSEIYARSDAHVEFKAPGDPVTDADREANVILCDGLAQRFPEAAIVGEESVDAARGDRTRADFSFFVDPVDGTRDFVDRTGQFAVMVGLVHEGRAKLGVVREPVTGCLYAAAPDVGAFVVQNGQPRPIRVSTTAAPAGAKMVVSRTRPIEAVSAVARELGLLSERVGSAGVKGVRVASGVADAFVHVGVAGYLWDACAVDAIVHAAGGRFTDDRGERLDYAQASFQNERGVVATNGHLHDVILAAIAATRTRSRT